MAEWGLVPWEVGAFTAGEPRGVQEYDREGEALDPESGMSWSPSLATSWSVPLGTLPSL